MVANVGGADKTIRIVLGIALLILSALHIITGTLMVVAYVVGAVALITGLIGFCPAWAVFGIKTCSTTHSRAK